jgi:hypothetical protein
MTMRSAPRKAPEDVLRHTAFERSITHGGRDASMASFEAQDNDTRVVNRRIGAEPLFVSVMHRTVEPLQRVRRPRAAP